MYHFFSQTTNSDRTTIIPTEVTFLPNRQKNSFFFFSERYLSGALASNEMILQHQQLQHQHQHQHQHQQQQHHQAALGQVPQLLAFELGRIIK